MDPEEGSSMMNWSIMETAVNYYNNTSGGVNGDIRRKWGRGWKIITIIIGYFGFRRSGIAHAAGQNLIDSKVTVVERGRNGESMSTSGRG